MTAWQTRESETVYENSWISVREDQVTRPDGSPGIYGVVTLRNPAIFVVPVTDEDEVVLVQQHRYTIGRDSWEVPAGGSDGEDPLVAAQRELQEETGLAAADWRQLPTFYSLNGVCNATSLLFLARGLAEVAAPGTIAAEGIAACRRVPWAEVVDLVRRGELHDGETIAALFHAAIALGKL